MTLVPDPPHPDLHKIPSVERLLQHLAHHHPAWGDMTSGESRAQLRDLVRQVLDQFRQKLLTSPVSETGLSSQEITHYVEREVVKLFEQHQLPSLRPVINATGVILHTNLGRAPLATEAIQAATQIANGYSNLEYNLESGKRGKRHVHCEALLNQILGCESAVVVNNCAASVLLTLDTFCQGGEVIISRGELIEIGGGFRIPDVMRKSGALLREVGTTNRTRISDYEQAITPQTRMILRVHPSNFRLIGFAQSPELEELTALAKRHGLICFEDLGSGALVDLAPYGVSEPMAGVSLSAGVDLVTFSGDKLLGGPQAGIIAGKNDLLDQIRSNPLMRALRVDKLTYSALEATLRLYADGTALQKIPILKALSLTQKQLSQRVRRWIRKFNRIQRNSSVSCEIRWMDGVSLVGGGSAPQVHLPTTLVALRQATCSSTELDTRLRQSSPPIIGRVENDWVLLDLRTVLPHQENALLEGLIRALKH